MARSASSGSRTASRPRLLGSETPRVFTPPLRRIEPRSAATEKRTLGYAVVDFASDVCGVDLFPWQQWLLVHALELLPDGSFRFRNVVVLVARQNGKSTLSQILSLFFLYVLGMALVIGTAQDLDVAEEIWQGGVDLVEETPELDALKERVVKVNGKKSLELKTGERWKVKAANRRAGRGLSGDLILLDELREHQSWDAWGAITKTTIARPNAQVWALSNAGDATSIVLRYLRKMAHQALGDPDGICGADDPASLLPTEGDLLDSVDLDVDEDFEVADDTLGLFEWSAYPGAAVLDRDGWTQANPALGHSITERTLLSAAQTDPDWVFRTECMCQWSDGTLEGPFPPGAWDAGRFVGEDPPQIVGAVKACVDVSADRTRAYVGVAGRDSAGRPQVEVAASRAGVDWVHPWLVKRVADGLVDEITGQGRGAPVSGLLDELMLSGLPVTKWEGPDLPAGTGRFYDAVRDDELTHLAQPVLDVAAATAVPKLTDSGAFLWDRRKSPTDIGPLVAVTGAFWLLTRPTEDQESVYETRGFLVLDI